MPVDSIQAASDLMAIKQSGGVKVAVANDKEAYGAGLATARPAMHCASRGVCDKFL